MRLFLLLLLLVGLAISKDVIVFLKSSPFISENKYAAETDIHLRAEKISAHLRKHAEITQQEFIKFLILHAGKVTVESKLWITNAVVLKDVSTEVLSLAQQHNLVERIIENMIIKMKTASPMKSVSTASKDATAQWNVEFIEATRLWELGHYGQGVVVANGDTGVRLTHDAVKERYRGVKLSVDETEYTYDHNYNWWDAVKEPIPNVEGESKDETKAAFCGYDVQHPCDANGHGTFTMSVVAGNSSEDAIANVGIAPKAMWISCRNMDEKGSGRFHHYLSCFQFFLAPTDLKGENPDTSKRPMIISNSWGCFESDGCDKLSLYSVVQLLRASGIFITAAIGNTGPSCNSSSVPGIYDNLATVGAVDRHGNITSFSSRGPCWLPNKPNVIKPDVVCPGLDITAANADSDSSYGTGGGTSAASPHLAGAVALLWSAVPQLRWNVPMTETYLYQAAEYKEDMSCGGTLDTKNNVYGYGLLKIYHAYLLSSAHYYSKKE